MYYMMFSKRHVVSFISTFNDVHSVDVLYFLITASARWFCTVLHWITCSDVVALMMMSSLAFHRAWGVTDEASMVYPLHEAGRQSTIRALLIRLQHTIKILHHCPRALHTQSV